MAKSLTGVVSSDKADKTIVVNVTTRKTHPIYKKQFTFTKKFIAHDEKNEAKQGDKVVITETRPISRRKHFTLDRVIERAPVRHVEETDQEIAEVTGQKQKEAPAAEEKPEAEDKKQEPTTPEETS